MPIARSVLENNPLWFKDAVIYQLHVKSFFDSNGDGIGDFKGLIEKLDYLKNLGITAIWLLPFYPSPLRDDGYDISDYVNIHPQYGTLKDFKDFLREAHLRGLRVITELVINHTSDQHPWFKRAKKSKPGSNYRNYYVWSERPDKYKDARVIFKDFEVSNWTWDEEAAAYYWHRFYSHQPDLNFDNQNVQKEILRLVDYWYGLGVDGLRLDAVPYLFEREGTNCENLPETYAFLKKLRKHVDQKYRNRMLLAEANQWPEDAVAYFGRGDECHMAFHFPLMPRMYMSVQMEDRFPIIDILEQTPKIPKNCQWAIFLRNHDELTLEMVTDEERDYMYRTYAKDTRSKINLGIRRRLVPLLSNNYRKIELMNVLLFSLPGTPVIYYGDEIGMGDNRFLGDRDGVRTPMQWSPDRNAGFSRANPQELYLPVIIDSEFHYESINVENQESNLSSMLWWMKRVIAFRKNYKAFSQGSTKFIASDNSKVLSFIRQHKDEIILVIINLSRFSQYVELDLKEYNGYIPQEVFSQNEFPILKDQPYLITLGAHGHFWLLLKPMDKIIRDLGRKLARIKLNDSWEELFIQKNIKKLETTVLPNYFKKVRWFGGKARQMISVRVDDIIYLPKDETTVKLLVVHIHYASRGEENYLLPLSFIYSKEDKMIAQQYPESILCRLSVGGKDGILFDGVYDSSFHRLLLKMITNRKKIKNSTSEIYGLKGKKFSSIMKHVTGQMNSHILKTEQSNTSILYDNVFFLKIFRKLDEGKNPDAEIIQFLTDDQKYKQIPPYAGVIEYRQPRKEPVTIGLLQGYVRHQSDAWNFSLDHVKSYFDLILSEVKGLRKKELTSSGSDVQNHLLTVEQMQDLVDDFYLEMVQLLGHRTAEMHLSLAAGSDHPDFKPESFSLLYQRSVYQSMGSQARFVLRLLKKIIGALPVDIQGEATPVLAMEKQIYARLKLILQSKYSAKKIRIHGDYHLGQVLFTGKDFVIIDFEGEPARALSERRIKRSVLRDLAGMLRSFHYVVHATLLLNSTVREEDIFILESAAHAWYARVIDTFLSAYFDMIGKSEFLPRVKKDLDVLLKIYLLDKAIYELGYELNNRPDWIVLPLRGIKHVMDNFQTKRKRST
ncbi:MAG: maltose alpha-D-glucosyltransferase [Candidatus Omnitrophica bacterium]|nr:maltose alpha-D-glucosyltransferase [Candidatus Omnitrophota bacterium]